MKLCQEGSGIFIVEIMCQISDNIKNGYKEKAYFTKKEQNIMAITVNLRYTGKNGNARQRYRGRDPGGSREPAV